MFSLFTKDDAYFDGNLLGEWRKSQRRISQGMPIRALTSAAYSGSRKTTFPLIVHKFNSEREERPING